MERRHREAALKIAYQRPWAFESRWADTGPPCDDETDESIQRLTRIAQALANAEQAAATKAWDEGCERAWEDTDASLADLLEGNPYRQPPKGDGDDE